MNVVTIAGADRGLTVDAMKEMEIGQVVDYVEEYNRIHDPDRKGGRGKDNTVTVRQATQADWDSFLG